MTWLFAACALAVGIAHARLLARSKPGMHGVLGWFARYFAVGLTLFVAARAGHLVAATLGWLFGFALSSLLVYRSLP